MQDLPDLNLPKITFHDTRQTRIRKKNIFCVTRQTRHIFQTLFFEKNVTRLDKFAQVMSDSRKFGASSHCLNVIQRNPFVLF